MEWWVVPGLGLGALLTGLVVPLLPLGFTAQRVLWGLEPPTSRWR